MPAWELCPSLRRVQESSRGSAGGEDGERLIVAPHQGQVLDLASADHVGNCGIFCFNLLTLPLTEISCVVAPMSQLQVQAQRLAHVQGDSGAHELLKAGASTVMT